MIFISDIKSGIYYIENLINNKKYIGQSNNIKDRWRRHISELNKNKHHNDYLQKSWNKYGENNFMFEIIEYCSIENLDDREQYWISDLANATLTPLVDVVNKKIDSLSNDELRKIVDDYKLSSTANFKEV